MRAGTWTEWVLRLGQAFVFAAIASAQLHGCEKIVRLAAPSRPMLGRILVPATARADVILLSSRRSAEPPAAPNDAPQMIEERPTAEPSLAAVPAAPRERLEQGAAGPRSTAGPSAGTLSGLLKGVRVVPERQGGRTIGLRLRGVSPDGLLGAIGLREGDRLDTINGYSVTEPNQMLALYARLQKLDRLSIAIERDGHPLTIEIKIG